MIRINLLPHREQKRAAHRKRFQSLLLGSVALALALTYLAYTHLESEKENQLARNARLEAEINRINQQLANIDSLRQKRSALLARKQLVERLQSDRTLAVHVFDELIRQVPEGVYLKDFRQGGNSITVSGVSLSGARVSVFMRNLAASTTFADPVLIEVSAATVDNIRANQFSLSIALRAPAAATPPQGAKP